VTATLAQTVKYRCQYWLLSQDCSGRIKVGGVPVPLVRINSHIGSS
jgi:hypothetical protein